ncbi:DNA-binding transcriptional regulator DicC [Yersinia frederiksenii]|uniref:Cro/CI family transcriptional regulator n=1 Tax=Yersinia frederiksenii TaxID=29484 RepID=UPI0005DE7FA6|nr:Cro/CI family transcriptional regulator [Yersinia frederiksenii]CNB66126.1 DNA-binding transcriptional regulator DicC [Yersinia frederiksenii]CNI27200.1 DNA-binding transcriptional regulator DicC [Yersinia frederiksenii]
MLKKDAIKYFGTKSALAKAAGVKPPSVSAWGELVPEKRAVRLEKASNGELHYDPFNYDKPITSAQ